MLDNILLYLGVLAAFTGMSVPQVLSQQFYLVPTHHLAEPVNVAKLPTPVMRTVPKKVTDDMGPVVTAKAAIVVDATSGMILYQKESNQVLPIASISKLMTAVVADDLIENWEEPYTLNFSEVRLGESSFTGGTGDVFTKHDLLKAALVGSSNSAAVAVAHATGKSDDEFMAAMNAKATALGMAATYLEEPTGLSANNVSSARDIALLMRNVVNNAFILGVISQPEHRMTQVGGTQEYKVKTTNQLLLDKTPFIIGGKTGFTNEAGNCLVVFAEDSKGNQIITVVLGSNDTNSRFTETEALVNWALANYSWPN